MVEKLKIRGGIPLQGEVTIRGSKNAATKMMIASLLTDESCVIGNVPRSADVEITKELCERIGSKIVLDESHRMTISTKEVKASRVPELSRINRIPVLALGPLLHRNGVAEVPVLGGCPIGHRPINFHVEALAKMGATVVRKESSYYAEANGLHGASIDLPYPSVGATESIILAASLAHGKTVVTNAAVEPEIMNLISMLRSMGAQIKVEEGSRRIEVDGVHKLSGATASVMPDRNEIVSFAVAALATEGDIFVSGVERSYLEKFLEKVTEAGGNFSEEKSGIRFWGRKPYCSVRAETSPHPGFMTDWQQPFTVLLTQAAGTSIIHETVYEDRFGYTKDLNRMGANIEVSDECLERSWCRFAGHTYNHSARVTGPTKLKAADITMTDIRAGIALLIATLSAEGESVVSGVEHVDRGYEKIDERLCALGADIVRVEQKG